MILQADKEIAEQKLAAAKPALDAAEAALQVHFCGGGGRGVRSEVYLFWNQVRNIKVMNMG